MHFACFGSGGCAAKAIISYPGSMAHVNINLLTHKNDTLSFGEPCSEKKSATNTRRVLSISTRRNLTPKIGTFSNDKNSGHFGPCPKRWAPGFPGTYFHIIHKYLKWAEIANYNIKKNNSRNQNLQGSTMGGGQGSTIISRTHSRTLEFTPRGVPILDTSYLRV